MIKYLSLIILAVISIIWSISVAPVLNLEFINPALLTGLILILLNQSFLIWAVFVGLILDIYSPLFFGVFTSSLIITFFINQKVFRLYQHSGLLQIFFLAVSGVVLYHLTYHLFFWLTNLWQRLDFRLHLNIRSFFAELIFVIIFLLIIKLISNHKYGQKKP